MLQSKYVALCISLKYFAAFLMSAGLYQNMNQLSKIYAFKSAVVFIIFHMLNFIFTLNEN